MCGLRGVARPVGKKRCMYIDMGLFALLGYIFCEQPRISCHCLCELNKEKLNEQEEDEE